VTSNPQTSSGAGCSHSSRTSSSVRSWLQAGHRGREAATRSALHGAEVLLLKADTKQIARVCACGGGWGREGGGHA
jgi:hypothetical protein